MWLAKQATIMRVSISVSARSASWKSRLTYNKVWPISVKVITNPAAVSGSKVRPITSILVATIGDRERGASYFWSKPRQEENQSLAAAHLHCHLVWTACGFHLKTVLVLSGGKKKNASASFLAASARGWSTKETHRTIITMFPWYRLSWKTLNEDRKHALTSCKKGIIELMLLIQ